MTEAIQHEIRALRSLLDSERDPGGRVFAPLADAYRRAGKIPEALRLLRDGLAKHPDFVTGHVVAAQIYVEQGLTAEAGIAAKKALELDGENTHALKTLLRVLDESGDAEAENVRSLLTTLEPDFQQDWTSPSRVASAQAIDGLSDGVSPEAPTVPLRALSAEPPAPAVAGAPELEIAELKLEDTPSPSGMIDLSTIGLPSADLPLSALAGDAPKAAAPIDVGFDLSDITVGTPGEKAEEASAGDLPLLDVGPLDLGPAPDLIPAADAGPALDLPLLEEEPAVEAMLDLGAKAAEPVADEPVMDLPLLAPEPAAEEPVLDMAALAPSPDVAEDVVELASLAPEPASEEPVVDLAMLAPDAEDDVVDVSSLAPDDAEEIVELAMLAPDAEDDVVDVSSLAPDDAEDIVELAMLAPDAEDDVMDVAALAPDADEPVVDLAMLAPDAADEEVVDVASLAPDVPTSSAPSDAADEPIYDLAALAPSAPESVPEPAPPAPPPASLAPDDEPVFDLDSLAPSSAAPEPVAPAPAPPSAEPVDVAFLSPDREDEIVIDLDELRAEPSADAAVEPSAASGDAPSTPESPPTPPTPDAPPAPLTAAAALVAPLAAAGLGPHAEPAAAAPPSAKDVVAADATDLDDEDSDSTDGAPLYTRTLAELYAKQGAVKQAIGVLRHLLTQSPGDADLTRRIAELEAGAPPVLEDDDVESLARDLAESGSSRPEVESPFGWSERESDAPPEVAGPTIRDYFDRLLDWEPRERA